MCCSQTAGPSGSQASAARTPGTLFAGLAQVADDRAGALVLVVSPEYDPHTVNLSGPVPQGQIEDLPITQSDLYAALARSVSGQ
jgi:hypothetical protein